MSKLRRALMQASSGASGAAATYVEDVFSTDLWTESGSTTPSADSTALSFDDQTLAFTDSGNKTIGWDGTNVRIHSLSTRWDLTSASLHSQTSSLSNNGGEYFMSQDGTRMYNNPGGGTVYQYTLGTAFDLSTATLTNSQSGFSTGGTASVGLNIKSDGTKAITQYGGSSTTSRFEEWTLTTPWDITTAALQNTTAAYTDGGFVTTAISNDGHYLFWLGSRADVLACLYLPTAWTCANEVSVYAIGSMPFSGSVAIGLAIAGDNNETLFVGNNTNGFYRWDFPNFDFSYLPSIAGYEKLATGLSLETEGFLIWGKDRTNASTNHYLIDSGQSLRNYHSSNLIDAATSSATTNPVVSVTDTGWGRRVGGLLGTSSADFASWTFRKQPGFFDVVTWSGDGTAGRQISHNLGSTPGFVAIKRTESTDNWKCWHTSTGDGVTLELDNTGTDTGENWPTGGFTSTYFTVNSGGSFNAIGGTYVAYLFAHDDQRFGTDSDESIIYCGTYEGNGTAVNEVTLGWEPQWILIKDIDDASSNWMIIDTMRGADVPGQVSGDTYFLEANSTDAENLGTNPTKWYPTPTGFVVDAGAGGANDTNDNGETYIYMAIRRPHKPASEFAATDLFSVSTRSGNGTNPYAITGAGFTVDAALIKRRNDVQDWPLGSRLTGDVIIHTSDAQGSLSNKISNSGAWDVQDGLNVTADAEVNASGGTYVDFLFKRAPGFFDVVAYSGDGVYPRAITHNLGVAPEIVIVKRRTGAGHWLSLWTSLGAGNRMRFDTAASASTIIWNSTLPTSTEFTVNNNDVNSGSETFVAYLFASSPGISKVGSYTGTGSDIDIDCGFTSGARFVLLKRTDDAASWYVFDTERGIVAGNDPMINLDTTAAEVTNTDYIDPISSGFRIPSTATSALNASGGNYIFLAIA